MAPFDARQSTPPAAADGSPFGAPVLVTYVIGTYPGLTTTFIDREIEALRRRGARLEIVSIRRPEGRLSPSQLALQPSVRYLLPARPITVAVAQLRTLASRPTRYATTLIWLLRSEHDGASRLRTAAHFALGVYLFSLLRRSESVHLHAHFADRAAVVALVAARLLDVTYSFTAHANDIYQRPVLLPQKASAAAFVVTCTEYNREHLARTLGPGLASRIRRLYHGLDLRGLDAAIQPRNELVKPGRPPLVLSVGQLKEKKGLAFLIRACRRLRERAYDLRCLIVGDGPLRSELEALAVALSVDDIVTFAGALPYPDVLAAYRDAAIFALPSVVASDGDRDGIPNVLLEAMAAGVPVVSTATSGIPEVVHDGETGLLVAARDDVALADAIERLLDDPAAGMRLGTAARELVQEHFDVDRNVAWLIDAFSSPATRQLADEHASERAPAESPGT